MAEPAAIGDGDGAAPVARVQAALERLERTEPLVGAYVHVDADGALDAAAALARDAVRGPLVGLPFGVKDVIDVAGMPSECGSRALAGNVADRDAAVVRLLRECGAIPLGKQVTHELTCGLDEPKTRNPWRLTHYPGGSSAGAGTSVAVGSAAFALGTDAAGSVRIPASAAGVVGMKATHGLIDMTGVVPQATAPSIDHVGIVARGVDDVARVLEVIAAGARGDAAVARLRAPVATSVEGVRIGVAPDPFLGPALHPEVRVAVEEALTVLGGLGAARVEVELPSIALAAPAIFTIFPAELASGHRRLLASRPDAYMPEVRRLLELGLVLPAAHLQAADRARRRIAAEIAGAFRVGALDALVTPTMPSPPPALDALDPATDLGGLIPFTSPFNLTGQPALTVPCGFTADGLPIGLQIVGRPFDEATVMRVGRAFEHATGWSARRPVLPLGSRDPA